MARSNRKPNTDYRMYIPPILFCLALVALTLLSDRATGEARTLTGETSPLALTDAALENYLYSSGFLWEDEKITDLAGAAAGTLFVERNELRDITALTLTFPLPTYVPSDSGIGEPVKAAHDAAAQRGEELFLCIFDALVATDGRIEPRRDSALEKLRATMSTGKAAAQGANSWRFSFSLEPDPIEGTVTILFTLVK